MAQDRMAESAATVKTLYGKENPCAIKGSPELGELMQKFIYSDVNSKVQMPLAQKELLTLVVLTANATPEDIGIHVKGALAAGATPAEIRETIYQTTPYVGFARAKNALIEMQLAFEEAGVNEPENAGTVTDATRYDDGLNVQGGIFGCDHILAGYDSAPADQKFINYYLSENCFGDYYTRKVLDLKQRELITFTAIITLGCCDPQAKAHVGGNLSVGNTRQDLLDAVTVALPYIGYPRTLNAISAINAVAPAK